ncbi:NTP transferase domain-containing protein [Candidatus Peregrinibacteria bacterium]|nr:NTP transferase domain-containing protein [Candidatus Peregrinibacteria bacterium]MBT7483989.1 NTP transferase domain-containing protein [Candidatus Peregrinibacteria bacterium]MBT7703672.1 NTP transferase domain-containing protein [Candidatus Peregrinibacteria bacterium]
MQILILCGGLGTRLRPLTNDIPKPMVPIDGKPFLEYLIEYYKGQGANDFILAVGYLREQIIDYFGDGSAWGVTIKYTIEENPLGTGGAIKLAEDLVADNFVVVNGDTFLELDLKGLMDFHKEKQALCTMSLKLIKRNQNSGFVEMNEDSEITTFASIETQEEAGLINAGVCVMSKGILDLMPEGEFSLEYEIFEKLKKDFYGWEVQDGYFIDIGTFDTYNQFVEEFHKINLCQ